MWVSDHGSFYEFAGKIYLDGGQTSRIDWSEFSDDSAKIPLTDNVEFKNLFAVLERLK
jgi:hypothetical protein